MDHFHWFSIGFGTFNVLSFFLGMLFGGTMYRPRALITCSVYFIVLALFFGIEVLLMQSGVTWASLQAAASK